VLQIQNAFCNAKQKSVVQSFTQTRACNASQQKKSIAISDIATISGILQHFLGVETGAKFNIGSICRGGSITGCSYRGHTKKAAAPLLSPRASYCCPKEEGGEALDTF